ncbi:hypothetical protein AM501_12915 [Aneurinibacillus migulanus]|uniref:Uncharacterized protein n=1 Tax=Aneurinibacillus migulanus TaxID=47500 RepID=A0A0D1X6T9_ANEMI|nr:hypothetical protein [Aneurinibacillus migulanus]KIV50266.1 hypothetical protein TS64_27100 [Aneurinibacillus migulanus]KIV57670.1 hypothetical protein TS65_09080 [Aneurinibacillus migulanus]KON95850.1 hypothetical protein AF333_10495 [Aneurinibacillus migulanus]KPD07907.1 hypothetical protein AM501_12915 [Aneurinibacillus migulanus]SDK25897.1 hypothetical protein SAMN04487909_1462 [Aneurinibacillus migulanus]
MAKDKRRGRSEGVILFGIKKPEYQLKERGHEAVLFSLVENKRGRCVKVYRERDRLRWEQRKWNMRKDKKTKHV